MDVMFSIVKIIFVGFFGLIGVLLLHDVVNHGQCRAILSCCVRWPGKVFSGYRKRLGLLSFRRRELFE